MSGETSKASAMSLLVWCLIGSIIVAVGGWLVVQHAVQVADGLAAAEAGPVSSYPKLGIHYVILTTVVMVVAARLLGLVLGRRQETDHVG